LLTQRGRRVMPTGDAFVATTGVAAPARGRLRG